MSVSWQSIRKILVERFSLAADSKIPPNEFISGAQDRLTQLILTMWKHMGGSLCKFNLSNPGGN